MQKNKKFLGIVFILVVLGLVFALLYYRDKSSSDFEKKAGDIFVEEEAPSESEKEQIELKDKSIVVHIDGEINKPGVYKLKEESILEELVKIAGGFTKDADSISVNLAELLVDNQKIIIQKKLTEGERKQIEESGGSVQVDKKEKNGKININTASAEELDGIPGVGPSRAADIITYRETSGGFKSIEDLKNVKGIGDKTFEKMKDMICN